MQSYSVFGGCLRSAIPFPELRPNRGSPPDWTLIQARSPAENGAAELLGEDVVDPGVQVRLYQAAAGFRLEYSDTGTFDLLRQGTRILWSPGPSPHPEAVRLDVFGRVLPLALHVAGTLCLHGSAVGLDREGIAFIAPKWHGKSTLAQALVAAGARLATDDAVAIDPGSTAMMRPGVPGIRLWGDSIERIAKEARSYDTLGLGKWTLKPPSDDRLLLEPLPLSAIYLLRPRVPNGSEVPVRRTLQPLMTAALALVSNAKLGPLLGKSEAALLLERVVAVARTVPVYELQFVRDWDHLEGVVEQLLTWHDATTVGSASTTSAVA